MSLWNFVALGYSEKFYQMIFKPQKICFLNFSQIKVVTVDCCHILKLHDTKCSHMFFVEEKHDWIMVLGENVWLIALFVHIVLNKVFYGWII